MKKMLSLVLSFMLLFTACNNGNAEKEEENVNKTVTDFCYAVSHHDFETTFALINPEHPELFALSDLDLTDPSVQEAFKAFLPFTEQSTIAIVETTIDGNTATVLISVTHLNLGGQFETLLEYASLTAMDRALAAEDPQAVVFIDIYNEVLQEEAVSGNYPTATNDYTVQLKKIDGTWYIDDYDPALSNALTANIAVA